MQLENIRLIQLHVSPLGVPLSQPFVIASARVEVTPNALIQLELHDIESDRRVAGWGEAATLFPVTSETQADVLAQLVAVAARLPITLDAAILRSLKPCASAGLDMALCDALAKLAGQPLYKMLHTDAISAPITTDITIAIGDPQHMAQLALAWFHGGFTCFKVKVGRDFFQDLRALRAIFAAVPDGRLRIDANGGYSQSEALRLCHELDRLQLPIDCFEQPCATDDLTALSAVTKEAAFDVIADESCKTLEDLDRLLDLRACDGVNLKLVKSGSLRAALAIGQRARENGLSLMVGAMVETRLGITAAVHLATALGGVEYPDLDTAFLLTADPFVGGYEANGAELTLTSGAGLDVAAAG